MEVRKIVINIVLWPIYKFHLLTWFSGQTLIPPLGGRRKPALGQEGVRQDLSECTGSNKGCEDLAQAW